MSEINWKLGQCEHLESPWGNAGGVVKTVDDVERMARTGVGWIEAGSYTLEKRYGNNRDPKTGEFTIDPDTGQPIEVYHHDPNTGKTYNSLGMPQKGMDTVEAEIPEMAEIAHAHNKKLIVNVAPVTSDPASESQELVRRSYEAGADAVLLNGGCPNVWDKDGERHEILSTNAQASGQVLNKLRPIAEKFKPVFYRISPPPSYSSLKAILRGVESSGAVSAVFVPNSFRVPIPCKKGKKVLGIKGETAGMTGPATTKDTYKLAKWAKEILKSSNIDIVRSGGIADWEAGGVRAGDELRRTLALGVLAAGTTFYYESEDWQEDTHKLLSSLSI